MHYRQGFKPSFCYITPIEYLTYTQYSNTHLVLAHMVHEDPDYAEFYRTRSASGDFLIMDNSAFELGESFPPEALLELAERCGAHAIVLPDYPGKHSSHTIQAAEKYIPLFKSHGYACMFVPQSETGDIDDWLKCYEYASNHPDIDIIGMSILGIPNAFQHVHVGYARVVATQVLMEHNLFNHTKHHHYLGLNSGPGLEIPSLLKMGALDTIDSSGPVWAGITGHRYCSNTDSLMTTSKVHMPVNFFQEWTNKKCVHDNIMYNITMTQNLFAGE